ncbi:uncharacterized protein LOC131214121 isoform X2 [Anopheles bellator]|uniref:uncharacterized protein LOC131214121 isoform X2 n=1 Tax=Anopheles bellator TaxID=139047 RepID=UPI00264817D4|nr:uncharacterized protein LOC131214121 isoform X2 [Anopheles bellator]
MAAIRLWLSSLGMVMMIVTVISTTPTITKRLYGSRAIDTLRHRYAQQEDKAWKIVSQIDHIANQLNEDASRQRHVALQEICTIYLRFVDDELPPLESDYGSGGEYFNILQRFSEWHFLEQNLLTINKLYRVAKSTICTFGLSAQQILYLLYDAIAMSELKGYLMMQFSYLVLKAQGRGNFTVESQARREELNTRLNRTQALLQRAMEQTSREYWRCDPEARAHRENETFLQFTRLVQGYIENEVDMNTENTCRESCAHYQYGHRQEQCYKELYCSRQPKCNGRIYECEYVDSDMSICPAAHQSQRRYEFIEYENGLVRGHKSYCARGSTKVDSWWRWIFWHCSYCFCLCDDNGPRSDRYVSLRESISDIDQNRVVTGLRFVKQGRVMHLLVQQGLLLPQAEIDNRTLEWLSPPDAFSVLAKGAREGRDYHTLTYDKRALDLDDVHVHPGYVLTGVRFRLLGTHLNLEIRMTEMNFTSGKLLDHDKSIWIGNDNTVDRTELILHQPDVPTRSLSKSVPDSTSRQYIRFGPSDRNQDAAQTTVPFIDAQPVYTHKAVPLSGAGLLHKGQPKYGGFVAPKLFTYNFTAHIQ